MRRYCDRCPARAKWSVDFISGPLDFCKHHYDRHEDALLDCAVFITRILEDQDLD